MEAIMNTSNHDDSRVDPPPSPSRACHHVLVIDDDPIVLHVLRRLLETRHVVTVASSVADLTQVLERIATFDAILCDFGLTTDDGTEIATMLLERWPERAPRLAVLTGNAMSDRVIAFARTQVVRLIAKPIGAAALFALIEELASGEAPGGTLLPFEE